MRPARIAALVVAAGLVAGAVSGCSPTGGSTSSGSVSSSAESSATGLTVTDAWIKAANSGMTAVFATIRNPGTKNVTITGATSSISPVEIHEMVDDGTGNMVMREKSGGMPVPAGKTVTFAPGGAHLMLVDLSKPIEAGADYEITLNLSDGSTQIITAQGRTYSGAKEDYQVDGGTSKDDKDDPSAEPSDGSGMNMPSSPAATSDAASSATSGAADK